MILDGISIDYFKQFKVTTCKKNLKAKQINTHGSRRRAHHFSSPHQQNKKKIKIKKNILFFFQNQNLKKIFPKKVFIYIKNPV